MDLKSQLNSLIQLQTVDSEIYALNKEKNTKPDEIKAIEANYEVKKQSLQNLEKAALDLQKQKKDRELELAGKEEGAQKLQSQLFQLKTNKEYQTMMQQIADAKADGSVIEEKILQIMEDMDKAKAEVDKEKQKLQAEEKIASDKKEKIQGRIKEVDDRLAQLEIQRKQNIPNIDPKVFTRYERILQNRDGLAIVTVKNNSCLGCNMFVPPQVINMIKMYDNIITCEMCNRILYIEE